MEFEPIEYDFEFEAKLKADRNSAVEWAKNILQSDFLILDTETTGLTKPCVIQVALIDKKANLVLNTLAKRNRFCPIGLEAFGKHRLDDVALLDAPNFEDVLIQIEEVVKDRPLLAYNSSFDKNALDFTCNIWGLGDFPYNIECVMQQYAKFVGNWDFKRKSYSWPRLPNGDHSAAGDILATLEVIRTMANSACT